MEMETTTATTAMRFKHINEFAGKIGMHRVNVYRALKNDDPDMWAEYADFVENKAKQSAYMVEHAKQRIARASKLAESENRRLHDEYLRQNYPEQMADYVNS